MRQGDIVLVRRRKFVTGLGAFAASVGTVMSLGTANQSVTPDSDMRVVVSVAVSVRRGNNVPADDAVNTVGGVDTVNLDRTSDGRVSNSRLDFGNLDGDDVPVAGVNDGENEDLVINVATGLRPGGSRQTIGELIEIANEGDETITNIGISYRTYGSAVSDAGHLSEQQAQDVYQFIARKHGVEDIDGPLRISPDPGTPGSDPDNRFALAAGETAQLDVENNNHDYTAELRSAAGDSTDPWSGTAEAIDILDEIAVTAKTDS